MLSTKDIQRHTPQWRTGDAAPVFLYTLGSVTDRATLEATLAGEYAAPRVFDFQLSQALRDGIVALADEDDRDRLTALVDAEAALEPGEKLPDDERALLDEVTAEVARYWPAYRALNTRRTLRAELAPMLAFRRFCVGWENIAVPFKRGRDGLVPDDVMRCIDPIELMSAGTAMYSALYAGDMEGNLPRGSQSDETPTPSTSDTSSPEAGKSAKQNGRKTPA